MSFASADAAAAAATAAKDLDMATPRPTGTRHSSGSAGTEMAAATTTATTTAAAVPAGNGNSSRSLPIASRRPKRNASDSILPSTATAAATGVEATTANAAATTSATTGSIRRLQDAHVRAIFECLYNGDEPPEDLPFAIIPVGPDGEKLSPPPYEFEDGLYVLLRPDKKSSSKKKSLANEPHSSPKAPDHLRHLVLRLALPDQPCPWSLSGPQFPQPTAIQQRYCYPKGSPDYSNRKGGALWTMFDSNGKENKEYRLLHVYVSTKRAANRSSSTATAPPSVPAARSMVARMPKVDENHEEDDHENDEDAFDASSPIVHSPPRQQRVVQASANSKVRPWLQQRRSVSVPFVPGQPHRSDQLMMPLLPSSPTTAAAVAHEHESPGRRHLLYAQQQQNQYLHSPAMTTTSTLSDSSSPLLPDLLLPPLSHVYSLNSSPIRYRNVVNAPVHTASASHGLASSQNGGNSHATTPIWHEQFIVTPINDIHSSPTTNTATAAWQSPSQHGSQQHQQQMHLHQQHQQQRAAHQRSYSSDDEGEERNRELTAGTTGMSPSPFRRPIFASTPPSSQRQRGANAGTQSATAAATAAGINVQHSPLFRTGEYYTHGTASLLNGQSDDDFNLDDASIASSTNGQAIPLPTGTNAFSLQNDYDRFWTAPYLAMAQSGGSLGLDDAMVASNDIFGTEQVSTSRDDDDSFTNRLHHWQENIRDRVLAAPESKQPKLVSLMASWARTIADDPLSVASSPSRQLHQQQQQQLTPQNRQQPFSLSPIQHRHLRHNDHHATPTRGNGQSQLQYLEDEAEDDDVASFTGPTAAV